MSYTAPFTGMRLLIVDDDATICDLLARLTSSWSFDTTTCGGAEAAIKLLEKQKFNIIVSDIKMGKINGIDFASMVREKMPSTAVVIMTGNPSEKTAMKSLELGVVYYLAKPIAAEELGETLRIAAAWNIGKLTERAAQRFHKISQTTEASAEQRIDLIKEAIRSLLRSPGYADSLRDFVYSPSTGTNSLFLELKKRFSAR